jgi:hypothetical protein
MEHRQLVSALDEALYGFATDEERAANGEDSHRRILVKPQKNFPAGKALSETDSERIECQLIC